MAATVLLTLGALQGVNAWGTLGHATVAYIAQNYVNDDVASWAQGVLGDTSDSYLANIASWADEWRSTDEGEFSAPFHYIDAEDSPPTSCNVDYDRDCGDAGCSVSAVANYTQRVADGRLSEANTAQALKMIVHLLGDLTQPLHDEALKTGGNDIEVTYQNYTDNLHSDWDTYMPQTLVGGSSLTDAKSWADELVKEIDSGDYSSDAKSWIQGDDVSDPVSAAMAWATDANAYVCTVVMPDGEEALTSAADLYPKYYNSVIPTIELQIAKGGYRLANWLNMVYDSGIAKRDHVTAAAAEPRALPDLTGRSFLPPSRPISRAKMARAAVGWGCNHAH